MRPIDADALKNHAYESREWSHGGHPLVVEVDDIDDMPTLSFDDLRPTGEWVMTIYTTTSKNGRVISNAKFTCPECGYGNGRKRSNYCPNCGAKMGGGK